MLLVVKMEGGKLFIFFVSNSLILNKFLAARCFVV